MVQEKPASAGFLFRGRLDLFTAGSFVGPVIQNCPPLENSALVIAARLALVFGAALKVFDIAAAKPTYPVRVRFGVGSR